MTFPPGEPSVPAPFNLYGDKKLAAEHLRGGSTREWWIPTTSLRYFADDHSRQWPDMALHRVIDAAPRCAPAPLLGDGDQCHDFVHVDDIVAASRAAVDADLAPGEVIRIARGSDAKVRDQLAIVGSTAAQVAVERQAAHAVDVGRNVVNASRAGRAANRSPRLSLADGIADQVAWHRSRSNESAT